MAASMIYEAVIPVYIDIYVFAIGIVQITLKLLNTKNRV